MTDIAIVWDPIRMRGDWAIANGDLQAGNDLETAVLVSLFTDRVLPDDQTPPDGTNDRRGWWADTFTGTPIGSRLWTLRRAVKSNAALVLKQARDMCAEALQWLIDDGVAGSIAISTAWITPTTLGIAIEITAPTGGLLGAFNYSWAWSRL